MKWTTKKPDKPGWWWYRNDNSAASVIKIIREGNLIINSGAYKYISVDYIGDYVKSSEWSSEPIPEPSED